MKKFIKSSRYYSFAGVCNALEHRKGLFIVDKYYSREFLMNWKLITLFQHYKDGQVFSYHKL